MTHSQPSVVPWKECAVTMFFHSCDPSTFPLVYGQLNRFHSRSSIPPSCIVVKWCNEPKSTWHPHTIHPKPHFPTPVLSGVKPTWETSLESKEHSHPPCFTYSFLWPFNWGRSLPSPVSHWLQCCLLYRLHVLSVFKQKTPELFSAS